MLINEVKNNLLVIARLAQHYAIGWCKFETSSRLRQCILDIFEA